MPVGGSAYHVYQASSCPDLRQRRYSRLPDEEYHQLGKVLLEPRQLYDLCVNYAPIPTSKDVLGRHHDTHCIISPSVYIDVHYFTLRLLYFLDYSKCSVFRHSQ